jgi:hypothetical protein
MSTFSKSFAAVGLAAVAAAVLAVGPQPRPAAAQPPTDLPPDLALVHPDALGFVHVRLADLWKHEAMKDARKLFEKAGPKALGALDEQFTPKPSTVERVTTVVLPFDGRGEPAMVAVLRFSAAFDAAAIKKNYLPRGKAVKTGVNASKEMFADEVARLAVFFPDDKTLVFSDPETLGKYLTLAPKDEGGLRDAVKLAAGKPVFAALNVTRVPFPPGIEEHVPEDVRPLMKAKLFTLSLDIGKAVTVEGKLTFGNGADAAAGEKAIRAAAGMARGLLAEPRREAEGALFGKKAEKGARKLDELPMAVAAVAAIGGLNLADEFLADPPVKTDGSTVTATATLPEWATHYFTVSTVGLAVSLPAVQKVRAAASRSTSMNNLKQIMLAMHNYEGAHNSFPPAAIVNKKGEKLLSWRVTILPFIEEQALYEKFKLDEPWDSENNKKLIPLMPKVYADMRAEDAATLAKDGKTFYKAVVGKDAAFDWVQGRRIATIADGTSNTVGVLAGGDPVIWSKPDDIEFDPEKKLPDLSKPFDVLLAAFCDGSVRTIGPKTLMDEKKLKALFTATGGEVIADDGE